MEHRSGFLEPKRDGTQYYGKVITAEFLGSTSQKRWNEEVTCLFDLSGECYNITMLYVVEYGKKLFYDRVNNQFVVRGL